VAINTVSGGTYARNLPGYLDPDQVDALIAQLAADNLQPDATFIVGHHPPEGSNGLGLFGTDDDLQRLIVATGADAYLFGHVHRFALTWSESCLQVQAPTLGNPGMLSEEPGFCLVSYDGGLAVSSLPMIQNDDDSAELDWPIVHISSPLDAELGDSNPQAQSLSRAQHHQLRALVYAAEEPTDVSFRVDDGEWRPMNAMDTFYQASWEAPQASQCQLEVRAQAMGQSRSCSVVVRLV